MTTTRGKTRTTISLALAGAATVGLAACGGGSSSGGSSNVNSGSSGGTPTTSAAPAARPDACKLLTAQLAASVIGKAKQSMHAQPNPQETHCQYKNTKAFVDIIVGPWSYVKSIDPNAKSVSAIGDDAEATASGLDVRKGDDGMSIDVAIIGSFSGTSATNVEAKQLQLEEKLAKKLLPGL